MQLKIKINLVNYAKYVGYLTNKTDDILKIDNLINIISCFTDRTKSDLYKVDMQDLAEAEDTIINDLQSLKFLDEPKGEVEINGTVFKFDKTLKTLNVGQMIDIKSLGMDFYNRPNYVMAVLYVNKDVPREEAVKLFADEFPINEYEACCRFFFQKYENWKLITSSLMMIRQKILTKDLQQIGTPTPTRFMLWLKILTGMWMQLRLWLIVPFYIGKNFSLKRLVNQK